MIIVALIPEDRETIALLDSLYSNATIVTAAVQTIQEPLDLRLALLSLSWPLLFCLNYPSLPLGIFLKVRPRGPT
jgi:hypothetical protein